MIPNSQRPTHDLLQTPRFVFHNTPNHRIVSNSFQGWSIFIQAQQVLVSATQFIADLNNCLSSQSAMHYMFERMQQLDSWTKSVLSQAEILPMSLHENDNGDHDENTTALCIRAISRIKLSRLVP